MLGRWRLSTHELRVFSHAVTPGGSIVAPRLVTFRGEGTRECLAI
jgi:hypothetical protein